MRLPCLPGCAPLGVTVGDVEIGTRVADAIEIIAIVIIVGAVVFAVVGTLIENIRTRERKPYTAFLRRMSNGLLIGLDLLIAADIITSVTVTPTLENLAGLGLLVLIRTFLSWTLIVEIEDRWPWQAPQTPEA